jgi:excisionase family DNA binding protein
MFYKLVFQNRGRMMEKIIDKEFLTTIEASQFMGISKGRLLNMVSNGKVPHYKLGRSNRYKLSELRELLLETPRGIRNGNKARYEN